MDKNNMPRLGAAILVAGLAALWPSLHRGGSFNAGMMPVVMETQGSKTLFVSRYEVTVASWRQCYEEHGCSYMPKTLGAATNPITGVNWFDVNEYLSWVNSRSAGGLRLPTLDEWRELDRPLAKPKPAPYFTDPRLAWAADYGQESTPTGPVLPQGSFTTTAAGISDLDGNVWEWTSSCYKPGFEGEAKALCPAFVAAGAHEAVVSVFVRNPASGGCATGSPPTHLGFRLVAEK